MHHQSILIKSQKTPRVEQIILKIGVNELDPSGSNPDIFQINSTANSIGVKDVKELITWSYKKPYQNTLKLGIIENAHKLTVQAQNSLLKTLEEPSPSTILVLITSNLSTLLPTILSRTKIIYLSDNTDDKPELDTQLSNLAIRFVIEGYLDRLKIIEELAKMDRAEIKKFIAEIMRELISKPDTTKENNKLIAKLNTCKLAIRNIASGGNIRLTLQTLAISMD